MEVELNIEEKDNSGSSISSRRLHHRT
ncbi:unnamed protein product, partial [Rotaria sordida]